MFYVPATKMAQDMDAPTLANMIITGKLMKESGMRTDNIEDSLKKVVSAKRANLLEVNLKAINAGMEYKD